jgi:hypothetical protein
MSRPLLRELCDRLRAAPGLAHKTDIALAHAAA